MDEILRLEQAVSLSAERRRVINGVSLSVSAGEFVAVYGPSGSGKTRLMHLCAGLVLPDDGAVFWEGRPAENSGVAFAGILQNKGLMEELTLLENAALPLLLLGENRKKALKTARGDFEKIGQEDYIERRPRQASPLQRCAACLVRAAIARPRLYMADCPTAGLTGRETDKLWQFCEKLIAFDSSAFLLFTDDLREAGRARESYIIREGKLERRDGDESKS